MPIDRRLDSSRGVLWTTAHGLVTVDDVRRHFVAVRDMSAHACCEVIDASRASPAFGVRDLRRLAEDGRVVLAQAPMAPRAVIVNRDHLAHYAVARLFASFALPWVTMRVFDSAPAALAYVEAVIAASA